MNPTDANNVAVGLSQEQIAALAKFLWNRYEYGLPESPMRMAEAIVRFDNERLRQS
jgi:hypothetical protein